MLTSPTLTPWEQPGITSLAQRYSWVHRFFQTSNESVTPTMTGLYPADYSTISGLALFPQTRNNQLVSAVFCLPTLWILSWHYVVEVQVSPQKMSLDNQQSTLTALSGCVLKPSQPSYYLLFMQEAVFKGSILTEMEIKSDLKHCTYSQQCIQLAK